MNDSGCFVVTWNSGNSVHYYSMFDSLYQHLDYFFALQDLKDIYSIQFNDKYCIIPDYQYNYDQKHIQILRITRQFDATPINRGVAKCPSCYDEWLQI